MKHGNDREKTIRQIWKDKDTTKTMIGGMPSGVQRVSPWIKDWKELYPKLVTARCTLCFNWLDQTATTSRYPEALSVGMIPFVWQNYDENNTYNIDNWQRIADYDMLKNKMMQLRNQSTFETKLKQYRDNYKQKLLSKEEYFKLFSEKMNLLLDIYN